MHTVVYCKYTLYCAYVFVRVHICTSSGHISDGRRLINNDLEGAINAEIPLRLNNTAHLLHLSFLSTAIYSTPLHYTVLCCARS